MIIYFKGLSALQTFLINWPVSVQLLSCVWLFATPWIAAYQASLSLTISRSLLKLRSFESVVPSNHLILCRPLLLLPSVFASIRVFSNESAPPIRWPKYWRFRFNISPSNEYSGLVAFRINSPCCPSDCQEFSPAPQFERINSSALGLLFYCTKSPGCSNILDMEEVYNICNSLS